MRKLFCLFSAYFKGKRRTVCTNCPEIVWANCLCKLFLFGWVVFWVGLPFMNGGGGEKRGVENLTNDTPPKKGFWTPLVRYVFLPPQVSVLCFSCTKIHDRADQKLFWRGLKIFGRARSLVRFPPPIRFAPPTISQPN